MTTTELENIFIKKEDEYLEFDKKVKHKKSLKRDIHAFLLLDSLFPKLDRPIICHVTYETVQLDIDIDELAAVITPEQVVELIRCGVRLDGGNVLCTNI